MLIEITTLSSCHFCFSLSCHHYIHTPLNSFSVLVVSKNSKSLIFTVMAEPKILELNNGSMQVKVSNLGCTILSLSVPDKDGTFFFSWKNPLSIFHPSWYHKNWIFLVFNIFLHYLFDWIFLKGIWVMWFLDLIPSSHTRRVEFYVNF